MKRIYETIITIIASIALVGVVEINAAERFVEDMTITDGLLTSDGYYEGAVFAKNLTLENVVIRKGGLKDVLVVGDLSLNGCFVANGALDEITVLGQQHIDDATTFFQDNPSSGQAGATFSDNVYIQDPIIGKEAYKGSIFFGDLTISSIIVEENAFAGAVIMGKLTIRSFNTGISAFQNVVLMGELSIEEPCTLISSYSFNGLKLKDAINLRLPLSIAKIETCAFRKANISAINIADCKKLKSIGQRAFYGCNIHTLQFPIQEHSLKISDMAFGVEYPTQSPMKPRKIFMPLHTNSFIHPGTAHNSDAWSGLYNNDDVYLEDLITCNDSVFLWLNPNDISSLPMTYGNGLLKIREYPYYFVVDSENYEASPDNTAIQKGNGKLFVPKGCKDELLSILKPEIRYLNQEDWWGYGPEYYFPIYSYFKEENIIEIDMGEYPNYRSPGLFGDINADKAVDEADATMMIDVILGGGFMHRSDLNVDGSNDGTDVSILLETIHAGE